MTALGPGPAAAAPAAMGLRPPGWVPALPVAVRLLDAVSAPPAGRFCCWRFCSSAASTALRLSMGSECYVSYLRDLEDDVMKQLEKTVKETYPSQQVADADASQTHPCCHHPAP